MKEKLSYDRHFHDDTHRLLIFAEASARARGSYSVEFDDLFLGILRMPESDASEALKQCAVCLDGALKRRKKVAPLYVEVNTEKAPYINQILYRAIAIARENKRPHALTLDVLLSMVEFAEVEFAENDNEGIDIDTIFQVSGDAIRRAVETIKKENQVGAMQAVSQA